MLRAGVLVLSVEGASAKVSVLVLVVLENVEFAGLWEGSEQECELCCGVPGGGELGEGGCPVSMGASSVAVAAWLPGAAAARRTSVLMNVSRLSLSRSGWLEAIVMCCIMGRGVCAEKWMK